MNTTIEILLEDEYIVAVNKPNDLLVYSSYYARNIKEQSLATILSEQFGFELYAIHRLDRKTSGIILFAKKKEYVVFFQNLFINNEIQKVYFAITRGFVEENGAITTPVKHPDTGKYKEAETHFSLINTVEIPIAVTPYACSRYSLVKFTPKTGRTHQLRIHANKISHPIIGDTKYGDRFHNRMFEQRFGWNNLFLHAYSLTFTHPKTAHLTELKGTFPLNWKNAFDKFSFNFDEL